MADGTVVHEDGHKATPTWRWFKEAVDGWLEANDVSPDIEIAYIDTSFLGGAAIQLDRERSIITDTERLAIY